MRGMYRHIAFAFCFLLLFAPLVYNLIVVHKLLTVNALLKIDENSKLKGAVKVVSDVDFNWTNWFDGDYQTEKEKYLGNSFGWRSTLVRANNQIHYSLFGTIRAKTVVEGRDGYLFETGYIDSYLGTNFVGKEKINEKVLKLKAINEVFERLDKHLVVVLAAGKGTYYSQFFPERYDDIDKRLSNYEYYAEKMAAEQIPFIDFNQHFLDIRDTTAQVLYPKSGIHWSRYGEVVVMDSLLQYFEATLEKDVPELKRTWVIQSTPLKRDNDLEKGMNLWFTYDDTQMTYQGFEFEKENKHLPVVLFVADSFYWGLHNEGFTNGAFSNSNFWFYNQSVWPPTNGKSSTKELDYKAEIDRREIVVLLGAEATLNNFAYGAIEKMYNLYVVPTLNSPEPIPK